MKHAARDHFLHAVLPAFEQFSSYYSNRTLGLRRDTRNAAAVAEALRDLSDHAFHDLDDPSISSGHKSPRAYRESFWNYCKEYQITCNFADAWKHHTLSRKDKLITSITDIIELIALIRYTDKNGHYYACRKLLICQLINGSAIELGSILENSLYFWIIELTQRGIISKKPFLPKLPSYFQSRKEAITQPPMEFIAYTKEPFQIPQRCFVFEKNAKAPRLLQKADTFHFPYQLIVTIQKSPLQEE